MDTLSGMSARRRPFGGADNDTLSGGDGTRHLGRGCWQRSASLGDAGSDTLNGGDGVDFLLGRASARHPSRGDGGNDTLNGNDGVDALFGGQGDDWLVGIDAAVDRLQGTQAATSSGGTATGTSPTRRSIS